MKAMRKFGMVIRPDVVAATRRANALANLADPDVRSKMIAGRVASYKRPDVLERASRSQRERWKREGERERVSAAMRVVASLPEQIEARRRGAYTRAAKALAWLPAEYRAEYIDLKRNATAAEAKRMVLASISRDEIAKRNAAARAPKARRSFEEELALVESGSISVIELPAGSRPFHLGAAGA
jgi:hypothetical protein